MAWLKLTNTNDVTILINTDNVLSIADNVRGFDKGVMISFIGDSDEYVFVNETFAEIELMLMGSKPSAPDPRERNVIGKLTFDEVYMMQQGLNNERK